MLSILVLLIIVWPISMLSAQEAMDPGKARLVQYKKQLMDWRNNKSITLTHYQEALELLEKPAALLTPGDARKLSVYLGLFNGEIKTEELIEALDAAERNLRDWQKRVDELTVIKQPTTTANTNREDLDRILPPADALGIYTNGLGMKFVIIPAGEYVIGSHKKEDLREVDEVRHRVKLADPVAIGQFEVTYAQFKQFVDDTGYQTTAEKNGKAYIWGELEERWIQPRGASWKRPGYIQSSDHPVVCISYLDAVAFTQWLTQREGRPYRLPTESEWEVACRAGNPRAYHWGNDIEDGGGFANMADQHARKRFPLWKTTGWNDKSIYSNEVGSYQANFWGIHDMHGNVWEWCQDWEGTYPRYLQIDPRGPREGTRKIVRGGSWYSLPHLARSASRYSQFPSYASSDTGFRVVVNLPESLIRKIERDTKARKVMEELDRLENRSTQPSE